MTTTFNSKMLFCLASSIALLCGACGAETKQASKPDCAIAAQAVIDMVKDRDASMIARVRKISDLEKIEESPDKFVCRGKGTFSDGNIAPILVQAHLQNGTWYYQSKQGSHLK